MPVQTPTFQEFYDEAKGEIQDRDPRLTDFEAGSALDGLTGASAVLADDVMRVGLHRWKAAYVDTAEGDDLDVRITDFGGPARKPAAAAVVPLILTRGAYVGAYTVDAGTEVTGEAPDGSEVAFTVDEDIVLGLAASSATGQATCTATGRGGNVPEGTLDTITGLPSGLTIGHTQRAAGGAEKETNPAYRARYRLFLAAQQRGTVEALEYGAQLVPGVTFATVDESTSAWDAGGYVGLFIGDPDGSGNEELADLVRVEIDNWRAAGVEVQVFAAEREELDFTILVNLADTSAVTDIDMAEAAIAYLDELAPSKSLYLSRMEAAVHALGEDIRSADITCDGHGTDRVIEPTEAYKAIRTAADGGGLTITITRVP
jgi:uncharacterized phage protein gp47/JayE